MTPSSLMDALGIETKTISRDKVCLTMEVTDAVKQPMGFLHGGASVALAETAASIGGLQHIDQNCQTIVGIEINCNHIKAKKDGIVQGIATPIHIGRTTMIWQIEILDEKDKKIAVSRCTLGVMDIAK